MPIAATVAVKFIKAPSGGIPARVGTLLGKATCDVWDTGTTNYTISDNTKNVEVLNWTKAAVCVNGDRYGIAGYWDGKWWIISEDCGDTQAGAGSAQFVFEDGTSDDNGLTSLTREATSGAFQFIDVEPLDSSLTGFESGSGGAPPTL